MFFNKTIFLAGIAILASASTVIGAPSRLSQRDFFCDVKNVHCCDELLSHKEAGDALGGILNLPSGLVGNVGLGCTPIGLANLGSCAKSTPVCCSQVYQEGLINLGCSPLSIL